MLPLSRRKYLQTLTAAMAAAATGMAGTSTRPRQSPTVTVRDRLWAWAHMEGAYNGGWGLPRAGRITPVEGAYYLGVPNVIFIRYEGKPAPPFAQYATPFRSLKQVYWSITGAGGATSDAEREQVFQLAAKMPNLTGVFMDDFFHEEAKTPQWLAANHPPWPVIFTLKLPEAAKLTRLELTQSDWPSGDYRTSDFAIDVPLGNGWHETARGRLKSLPQARAEVRLSGKSVSSIRLRLLGTHDTKGAMSVGLCRVRGWAGDVELSTGQWTAAASSSFPGFSPAAVLSEDPLPAAMSVEQLRKVRERLRLGERRLDLGVTLYTSQLSDRARPHLSLCDVISLWTWKAADLEKLEENLAKLRRIVPDKRLFLGCYMWDFAAPGQPMPLELMQHQCDFALKRLKAGEIEGVIFLATNLCDLDLETVEWTRQWIARHGDDSLRV